MAAISMLRSRTAAAAAAAPAAARPVARPGPLLQRLSKAHWHRSKASALESISIDEDTGSVSWDSVSALGEADTLAAALLDGYTLRPGQVPAAAPVSTLPTRPDSLQRSTKPVVLIKDTNCWCPFCERVWLALEEKQIPYDAVLIELYNKPAWYKELVPTSLVPAVCWTEDGAITYESRDILLELEERFPHAPPLLPTDPAERAAALELLERLEGAGLDRAGYTFMTGGRALGRRNASSASSSVDEEAAPPPAVPDIAALKADFLKALAWFEGTALAAHEGGPYLLGAEFSLLDVMAISSMERLAAGLPKFRGFDLRQNPDYPRTGAWLAAIAARPAYQRVCSDDQTLQLLFSRMMGLTAGAAAATSSAEAAAAAARATFALAAGAPAPPPTPAEVKAARDEAFSALQGCVGQVVRDVLIHSGITRYQSSPFGATARSINGHKPRVALPVRAAVENSVLRVLKALLLGSPGPKPDTSIAAAFGAVTAAFLRNRYAECGALAALSPAAVEQLQAACTQVLTQSYADGVDALAFAAPARGPDGEFATPEEAAAAAAAAEAAAKIQRNRAAIVEDILAKSGLARPSKSAYGSTFMSPNGHVPTISAAVRDSVVFHLDRLCSTLLTGSAGPRAAEPEAAAIGAAALAFFRNRASAPRDMSAAATAQFRAACDAVLAQVF